LFSGSEVLPIGQNLGLCCVACLQTPLSVEGRFSICSIFHRMQLKIHCYNYLLSGFFKPAIGLIAWPFTPVKPLKIFSQNIHPYVKERTGASPGSARVGLTCFPKVKSQPRSHDRLSLEAIPVT